MMIAVGVVSLYVAVWRWFGAVTQDMAHAPILIVLLAAQLWILHGCTAIDGIRYKRFLLHSPMLPLLLPLLVVIPLSVFVPAVGAVTALGAWHPAMLIALPLFPLAFFLSKYFIVFFHRTAK